MRRSKERSVITFYVVWIRLVPSDIGVLLSRGGGIYSRTDLSGREAFLGLSNTKICVFLVSISSSTGV